MATVQLRNPRTEGRAYYDRKKAAGKSSNEAMRCHKRRLSDLVFKTMLDDAAPISSHHQDGPGRTLGNDFKLQRDRLTSHHRLFEEVTSRTRHEQA